MDQQVHNSFFFVLRAITVPVVCGPQIDWFFVFSFFLLKSNHIEMHRIGTNGIVLKKVARSGSHSEASSTHTHSTLTLKTTSVRVSVDCFLESMYNLYIYTLKIKERISQHLGLRRCHITLSLSLPAIDTLNFFIKVV